MTETATKPAKLDKLYEPLPEGIRTQLTTLPEHLNPRDARGDHLSPRMGRLVRAFRAANGNISQKELAEKAYAPEHMTTHCQIATLEQGGCKKGANPQTINLLAHALKVKPDIIKAINEADLKARADRGDEQAKKVLGIADETKKDPSEVAGELGDKEKDPTAETVKKDSAPTPSAVAKKTTSAPPARPEGAKEKVKM